MTLLVTRMYLDVKCSCEVVLIPFSSWFSLSSVSEAYSQEKKVQQWNVEEIYVEEIKLAQLYKQGNIILRHDIQLSNSVAFVHFKCLTYPKTFCNHCMLYFIALHLLFTPCAMQFYEVLDCIELCCTFCLYYIVLCCTILCLSLLCCAGLSWNC